MRPCTTFPAHFNNLETGNLFGSKRAQDSGAFIMIFPVRWLACYTTYDMAVNEI
jgi:hypothetical protein